MKTIAVVILILTSSILIGLPIQNISADNLKMHAPIWGKAYTNVETDPGSPTGDVKNCFYFIVHAGDNITINTTISGSSQLWFGGMPLTNICASNTLPEPPFYYTSTSNEVMASVGYIDSSTHFWITSNITQMMIIVVRIYIASSSILYTINKFNATPTQDPAIKVLQNQVKALQTNMTNVQTQISTLTKQINTMNNTQRQMIENIINLWNAIDKLNASLINLSQNYAENLANVKFMTFLNDRLDNITLDLKDTNDELESLEHNVTNPYDDTALKNQIAQLQKNITQLQKDNANNDTALRNQIAQLRTNIDTLNHTKSEKTIQKEADNTVSYGAIALGIVALLVGIIAIMTRMPKAPMKDDNNEVSRSKDYYEVEEIPKPVPKAKAKKSKNDDDEDLDDVMKKLEK